MEQEFGYQDAIEYTCQWPAPALSMTLLLSLIPMTSGHHLEHLLSTYYVPGTFLRDLRGLFHLILTTAL